MAYLEERIMYNNQGKIIIELTTIEPFIPSTLMYKNVSKWLYKAKPQRGRRMLYHKGKGKVIPVL
jgi:hypothetical protein